MSESLCIPNIGKKERKKCYIRSVCFFAVAVIATALLLLSGVSAWWRLLLVLPFWMGFMAFFIARGKT
jgi:hypothetical protein